MDVSLSSIDGVSGSHPGWSASTNISYLQIGHALLLVNHCLEQTTWKKWPHGSVMTVSLSKYFLIQIVHIYLYMGVFPPRYMSY